MMKISKRLPEETIILSIPFGPSDVRRIEDTLRAARILL